MKHFAPHALMLLALAAGAAGTLSENVCLGVLFAAHLLAPLWSAYIATRETRTRSMLLGPGTIIGLHAIGVVLTLLSTIGGVPEGTWITLMIVMLWAVGLAAYTLYCAVTFSVISHARGIK